MRRICEWWRGALIVDLLFCVVNMMDLPDSRLWDAAVQQHGEATVEAENAIGLDSLFDAVADAVVLFTGTWKMEFSEHLQKRLSV